MQVWPAIDLRGGKCVRLEQGDYNRETIFGEDPTAMARHWVEQGADRLHLVDLDGARDGRAANAAVIASIVRSIDVPCQLGGGIRDESIIQELLALGIARLVVGTRALREPEWFRAMCRKYPHKLVLGLDARDGQVATDGWLKTSGVSAIDLAQRFADEPVAAIVYTDIATDGMLSGPNLAAVAAMCTECDTPIVASGGVSKADDVRALAELPIEGCIVGRALYEPTMTLREGLTAARQGRRSLASPTDSKGTAESRRTD
ncbi:MAG: 1-(5-phosphoribosyl)-5-[(5-phosphoribosylamino)methylideneamino]imidazole-4-carboxamide isomerase [Planctomycetes bacterium]|nr:1-(5-phosphoribosyl)-5-[(5-phosphoribosylamino)methylideneamino]imidazole-4-carboxamide isomerase [Planctomycetota bacterium]